MTQEVPAPPSLTRHRHPALEDADDGPNNVQLHKYHRKTNKARAQTNNAFKNKTKDAVATNEPQQNTTDWVSFALLA